MSPLDSAGPRHPLEGLLSVDPDDAGCGPTWQLVHVYAEIEIGGGDPAVTFPGVSAHLRACPPCAEDYEGLVNALSGTAKRLMSPIE